MDGRWRFQGWAVLLLAGCVPYQPRPIDLAARRVALEDARLDDADSGRALTECGLSDTARTWTRAAFACVATARSPRLAESRALLDQAVAATRTAHAYGGGALTLSADRSVQDQADSARWLWGLALDLPLDGGRRRRLRMALADVAVRRAVLDLDDATWRVRRDADAGVRRLLSAREQARIAARLRAAAEDWLDATEARIAQGEAPAAERSAASGALARALADDAAARQALVAGAAQAAQAAGLSTASVLAADWATEWTAIAPPPAPARLAAARAEAPPHRTDVVQALDAYAARELDLQEAVRRQYPQISIGPGYTDDHGLRKLAFNLSLSLPSSDLNAGPIAEAEAQRAAAAAHVDGVLAQAIDEIDAASAGLAAARTAWNAADAAWKRAEARATRTAEARRLGAEDRGAQRAAEVDALDAELQHVRARDALLDAQAALEDALRRPLEAKPVVRADPETLP